MKDYLEPVPVVSNPDGLRISMGDPLTRSANADAVLGEMRLYCFDRSALGGAEPAEGTSSLYEPAGVANPMTPFHHVVQGLTKSGMTLYTSQMRAGKWDVAMVAHRGASFTAPVVARRADQLLMYTFDPLQNGGQAHEFYHSYCRLPEVTTNNHPYVNTAVSRNVAKVRVVIERAVDIHAAAAAGSHTVTLDGVPRYISWAGTLLKNNGGNFTSDKNDFDVFPNGTAAFVKNVTFTAASEAGTYKSDTLDYIIPAYRSADFWQVNPATKVLEMNSSPSDTLTRKMTLSVSFAKASGGVFTKSVTIPRVAQCNKILLLKVRMSDVTVEIRPDVQNWAPTDIEGNTNAAYLNVSRTSTEVYDGAVSRVYFWSNQPLGSISVANEGKTSADALVPDVNTIFDRLAGTAAANFHYDPTSKEGYIDICQSNTSTALSNQLTKIYLTAGGLKREIVVKRNVTALAARNLNVPYVGTFHRASQTGERVVTWSYAGDWNAVVEGPGASEVLLDRQPSPAFSSGALYGTNPPDAEQAVVSDWGGGVTGKGRIYFRVGWKSSHAASEAIPARYARIVVRDELTAGRGNVIQTLYLRQGEGADYLMRPADRDGSGAAIADNRSFARKFSPYNLTSPDRAPTAAGTPLAVYGGEFVLYPTHAGAFFQWANNTKPRYAYSPIEFPSGWNSNAPTTYWNTLGGTNETCPPGYRRPNDGSTAAANLAGAVAGSEIRQSMWLNPQSATNPNADNSVFGYYADGFFDRNVASLAPNTAYIGRLFFNSGNSASVFFPAAGVRKNTDGGLETQGERGGYWTGSAPDGNSAWNFSFTNGSAYSSSHTRSHALSLRCVAAENATLTFHANGAAGAVPSAITAKENTAITLPGKGGLNKVDYYFSGWNTAPDGSGTQYAVGSNTMPVGGGTLYARWLQMEEVEEIIVPNSSLTGNVREIVINVSGGDDNSFRVVGQRDGWFTATVLPGNKLRITADQSLNADPRESTVTIAHNSDLNYRLDIKVSQYFYTDVPAFDYLVLEFIWTKTGSNDMDVAVEFNGNKLLSTGAAPAFDQKPVGYMFNTKAVGGVGYVDKNGAYQSGSDFTSGLLYWGGDANKNTSDANGESIFINIPLIDQNDNLGRYVKLDAYNVWYQSPDQALAGKSITMRVYAYKGGSISFSTATKLFTSASGGINVYPDLPRSTRITKNTPHNVSDYDGGRTFVNNFQKVATITYDRKSHKANVQWYQQ